MAKLTPLAKGLIAVIVIAIIAFIALQFLSMQPNNQTQGTSSQKLNVILVGKSFDSNTLYIQQTLSELLEDPKIGPLFKLTVIDADLEPQKVEALGFKQKELPCYLIGTEKHCELYSKQWFELKIKEQSDILKMSKKKASQ